MIFMTKAKKVMGDSDSIRRHEGRTYKVAEYEVGIADFEGGHRFQNAPRDHEKDILSSKRNKDSVCGLTVNDEGSRNAKGNHQSRLCPSHAPVQDRQGGSPYHDVTIRIRSFRPTGDQS